MYKCFLKSLTMKSHTTVSLWPDWTRMELTLALTNLPPSSRHRTPEAFTWLASVTSTISRLPSSSLSTFSSAVLHECLSSAAYRSLGCCKSKCCVTEPWSSKFRQMMTAVPIAERTISSSRIVVCSLYPTTAWQLMAFMWERISVRISAHQTSRVSGSSETENIKK